MGVRILADCFATPGDFEMGVRILRSAVLHWWSQAQLSSLSSLAGESEGSAEHPKVSSLQWYWRPCIGQ